jgi:predicted methyltransferase
MTTSSSSFVSPCFFRADGVYCEGGYLCYADPKYTVGVGESLRQARVMVEGEPVTCTCCEGRGVILTPLGKDMLTFIKVFGRSEFRDLVDELFEEREQR